MNLVFIPGSNLTDKFFLDNCSHDDHFSLAAAEREGGEGEGRGHVCMRTCQNDHT